jgi:hypothetical protein
LDKETSLGCSSLDDVGGFSSDSSFLFWLVLVKLHKFGKIELWLFKDLDLSDHAVVLEREDLATLGLDLFANFFFKATKLLIIYFANRKKLTKS